MTINDQIRDKKLQYDINREAAKISAWSSGKIQKYDILLVKLYYHLISNKKQVDALNTLKSNNQLTMEDLIPKNALINEEAKKELHKIKEIEKNVGRQKLIYETDEYTYCLKNFQTIKIFGRDIYEGKITIKQAD